MSLYGVTFHQYAHLSVPSFYMYPLKTKREALSIARGYRDSGYKNVAVYALEPVPFAATLKRKGF